MLEYRKTLENSQMHAEERCRLQPILLILIAYCLFRTRSNNVCFVHSTPLLSHENTIDLFIFDDELYLLGKF